MLFNCNAEFRGCIQKESSKGNKYNSLIFEDIESGEQLRCYSPLSRSYKVPVTDLKKGSCYDLSFNYHFDYGKWQLDLIGIE